MSDWAEKNRAHFNSTASTYNAKFGKSIKQILSEVQERREWIGVDWVPSDDEGEDEDENKNDDAKTSRKSVRFLDYACGTGTVSRALAPYVTQTIGVDISSGMVEEYNTVSLNQGIPSSEMRALVGDLIDSEKSTAFEDKEFWDFDVAAVGMGFHHFADPTLAAVRLAERLKKGGVLFIIDFLPHAHFGHGHGNGHDHGHGHEHGKDAHEKGGESHGSHDHKESVESNPAAHTVTHMGFSEEDIQKIFQDAGVGKDFGYVVLGKGIVFTNEHGEQKRTLFIARGTKA